MGIHDGHRERLKNSFRENGLEGFNEITALELVLFYALPRVDTNPVAHRLLDRFHSLSGVLNASVNELTEVDGVGENTAVFLKLLPEFIKKAAVSDVRSVKQITSPALAAEYLIPQFMFEEDEKVLLLCLDASKRVIRCEEISRGVVNTVDLNTRMVAETALKNKSSSVIAAHNHPDGNTAPSPEDISTTKTLNKSLNLLGIQLVDHIIVSGGEYTSLCELGYL